MSIVSPTFQRSPSFVITPTASTRTRPDAAPSRCSNSERNLRSTSNSLSSASESLSAVTFFPAVTRPVVPTGVVAVAVARGEEVLPPSPPGEAKAFTFICSDKRTTKSVRNQVTARQANAKGGATNSHNKATKHKRSDHGKKFL